MRELEEKFKRGDIDKHAYIEHMHDLHASLWEFAEFISDKNVSEIIIKADSILLTTRDGVRLVSDPDDQRIIPVEIMNFGNYETIELEMVMKLYRGQGVFLDIGANIGWYSINVSRAMPDAKIHAFEPIPNTFSYLIKNLVLNNTSNVIPHNIGFAEQDGELDFFYYKEVAGNTSLAKLSRRDSLERLTSNVRRLDEFVENNSLEVEFIKCDVEGAELLVFKGGTGLIEKQKPIVFTELLRKWAASFGYHPQDVVELFFSMGYGCFTYEEGLLKPLDKIFEDTTETNFFFLHHSQHAAQIKEHGGTE